MTDSNSNSNPYGPTVWESVFEANRKACRADWASLRKCDKRWLVSEFRRSHRVCDTKGMAKMDLIAGILEARYGRKILNAI